MIGRVIARVSSALNTVLGPTVVETGGISSMVLMNLRRRSAEKIDGEKIPFLLLL